MTDPTKKSPPGVGVPTNEATGPGDATSPARGEAEQERRAEVSGDVGDASLDELLGAMRDRADSDAQLSDQFYARLVADAEAVLPTSQASTAPGSLFERILAGLGFGWPVGAGLSACAVAGLWVGYAPPAALDDVGPALLAETGFVEDDAEEGAALLLAFDEGGFDG